MRNFRRIAACIAVAAFLACSSHEKKAKEQASWDAAAAMTVRAWVEGSVSTRFAADALQAGNRATGSSRYEAARQAILKEDRRAAQAAIAK